MEKFLESSMNKFNISEAEYFGSYVEIPPFIIFGNANPAVRMAPVDVPASMSKEYEIGLLVFLSISLAQNEAYKALPVDPPPSTENILKVSDFSLFVLKYSKLASVVKIL